MKSPSGLQYDEEIPLSCIRLPQIRLAVFVDSKPNNKKYEVAMFIIICCMFKVHKCFYEFRCQFLRRCHDRARLKKN